MPVIESPVHVAPVRLQGKRSMATHFASPLFALTILFLSSHGASPSPSQIATGDSSINMACCKENLKFQTSLVLQEENLSTWEARKQKLLVRKLIFSPLWLNRRLASHCILSFRGNVFLGFVYSLLFKLLYSHDASTCLEHPRSRSRQNPSPLAFPPCKKIETLGFWWCGSEVEKNNQSCLRSGFGDFQPNALRSRLGVNDSLSSIFSTDLDREQVSSTSPCGGRRRMHAAQHKKRQRIGKRIVASLWTPSNQKPKKTNSSQEQCCSFWTFHFLLLFLLTPRTKTPQKQRTRSQHKTTSATTAKKERGEKQKNNDQILSPKVSLLERERERRRLSTTEETTVEERAWF